MDKLTEVRAYAETFRSKAAQLNSDALAVQWYRMGVSAEDAAAWANSGHMPGEAAQFIADGITPQTAAEADAALGGSVLERIAFLADAGIDTTGVDLTALD